MKRGFHLHHLDEKYNWVRSSFLIGFYSRLELVLALNMLMFRGCRGPRLGPVVRRRCFAFFGLATATPQRHPGGTPSCIAVMIFDKKVDI